MNYQHGNENVTFSTLLHDVGFFQQWQYPIHAFSLIHWTGFFNRLL